MIGVTCLWNISDENYFSLMWMSGLVFDSNNIWRVNNVPGSDLRLKYDYCQ